MNSGHKIVNGGHKIVTGGHNCERSRHATQNPAPEIIYPFLLKIKLNLLEFLAIQFNDGQ